MPPTLAKFTRMLFRAVVMAVLAGAIGAHLTADYRDA